MFTKYTLFPPDTCSCTLYLLNLSAYLYPKAKREYILKHETLSNQYCIFKLKVIYTKTKDNLYHPASLFTKIWSLAGDVWHMIELQWSYYSSSEYLCMMQRNKEPKPCYSVVRKFFRTFISIFTFSKIEKMNNKHLFTRKDLNHIIQANKLASLP